MQQHNFDRDIIQEWVNTSKGRVLKSKPVNEVVLFKAEEKYVSCYFLDGTTLLTTATIKEMIERYPDQFIQVNRGALVHRDQVKSLVSDMHNMYLYVNGTQTAVAVSRRLRSKVRAYCKERNVEMTKLK